MPRSSLRPTADDTAKARKKNSSIIVVITAVHLGGAPVADVASLDALVEIAKKYETMILELVLDEHTEYLLWDDGMVFRFRDVDGASSSLSMPTPSESAPSAVKLVWEDDEDTGDVPVTPPTG